MPKSITNRYTTQASTVSVRSFLLFVLITSVLGGYVLMVVSVLPTIRSFAEFRGSVDIEHTVPRGLTLVNQNLSTYLGHRVP